MYNFVLHNHLRMHLLFRSIVENDVDQDDQHFDQNAEKRKKNQSIKFLCRHVNYFDSFAQIIPLIIIDVYLRKIRD